MRAGGQCSPSIIPPTMYSLYLRDEGEAEILRQMSALMGIRIPDYLVAAQHTIAMHCGALLNRLLILDRC